MKRKLYLLLSVLLLTSIHAAATPASLSIEDFSITAGETKEMLIDLNSPDADITLVQFDLRLPEGLSIPIVDGYPALDIAGRTNWRTHTLETNEVGGALRVLLYSSRNSTIPGTSGALISVTLEAAPTFNGGSIVLQDILLVTPQQEETKPADLVYTIEGNVLVSTINLSLTSYEMAPGSTIQLSATVNPSNATNKGVRWSSSNSAIARVDDTGLVTAVAAGSAVITCEAQDGSGVKATCVVTVKETTVLITNITLNASNLELSKDEQFQLVPTISPSNATNKSLIWNSSSDSIVKVDNYGMVTAVKQGSAAVTCMANDGSDVWAMCRITVKAPVVSDAIQFADAEVKRICVQNWDNNGDGELSEDEAAAVSSIGKVFKGNELITSFDELKYFTNVTSLDFEAFSSCYNLISISLPNSLKTINQNVFVNCTKLQSVQWPNNNGFSLHFGVFQFCSFTSMTLPKNLISFDGGAFIGCSNLTEILFDEANPNYCSIDGVVYSKDKKTIVAYPNGKELTEYTILSGVENIGASSFSHSHKLLKLNIPSGVKTLGSGCFESMSNLRSLTIPEGVTEIPVYCCAWNNALEEVNISENVTKIGNYAFADNKMARIVIPSRIRSIGEGAFLDRKGAINEVVSYIDEPFDIDESVFYAANDQFTTATLKVPAGTKYKYQQAAGWKNFKNILEMNAPAEPKLALTKLWVEGDHLLGQHTAYFNVRNEGTATYNDYIYVCMQQPGQNDVIKSGDVVTIAPGTEEAYGIHLNFTIPGVHHIWVAKGYDAQEKLGEITWEVVAPQEEKGYTLVVLLKSGHEDKYVLKERPEAWLQGTQLRIESATMSTSYERTDIEKFYFLDKDGNPSGIKAVAEADASLTVRQLSNGQLLVSGLADGDAVRVFDLSGRLLNTIKADGSDTLSINLLQQPKGVYIININNKRTIKLQVK